MNVLLVDGSRPALKYLKIIIKQIDKSVNIFISENIKKALNILNTELIEIAFIELQMPEKNGVDLIMNIRNDPSLAQTRLVIVTDTGEDSLLKTSLEQIVELYLHKPVSKWQISKLFN